MAKTFTREDVLKVIQEEIERTSIKATADRLQVTTSLLYDVLKGNRAISAKVAEKFGFKREIITQVIFRKSAA